MLLYIRKKSEKFRKEGKERALPHHPNALVVVLGTAEAALPKPLRKRLELLKLERLATDEIGDSCDLQENHFIVQKLCFICINSEHLPNQRFAG